MRDRRTFKRPAKRQPRWTIVSSSLAPDPRLGDNSPLPQRLVHIRTFIDSRGRAFEKIGREAPMPLDDPPADE